MADCQGPPRLAVAAAALTSTATAQKKKLLAVDDLWHIERVGAVSLAPDGAQAVCSLTRFSMDDNKGASSLWMLSTFGGEARRLTSAGEKDGLPAWSPQGDRIAFIARREQEGRKDDTPQLCGRLRQLPRLERLRTRLPRQHHPPLGRARTAGRRGRHHWLLRQPWADNTLKAKGVDARLVWFPDENHWILKPRNSKLWYREFFDWLKRFDGVKGRKVKAPHVG
jgi:dipeptidyl aminopeptidase/acylaminoacyl peptidase